MKKFLVGVGDVVAMQDDKIVFYGKTMLNTGIEVSTSNTEIRGGQGNQLQAVYYHTGTLNATITDTQWSLPLLALNTGASITSGGNVWDSQSVTISNGAGTLVGVTNAEVFGGKVYIDVNGDYQTFELNSGAVTFAATGVANGNYCVSFLKVENSAETIVIPANIIPSRVHLYITANLSGDTTGQSGFIGKATIEIPVFQLSGAQNIEMTADGYSNTEMSGMAIAYAETNAGCGDGAIYAKITETIFATHWYDNATALAIQDGDQSIAVGGSLQLKVWYVANGRSLLAPTSDLTFSKVSGNGTVTSSGVVSSTSAGTTQIKVVITDKPEIEAYCNIEAVSA